MSFRHEGDVFSDLRAQRFYFVHSYKFSPDDPKCCIGVCEYGQDIVSMVEQDNIFAVQFHPEKSHHVGLRLLRNWCALTAMLKHRLIPVLLLKNGLLVRSQGFHRHQIIGNPIHEVQRFNEWSVDELIYLDISQDDEYDLRRDDQRIKGLSNAEDILTAVSENCFIPLTWGGRIRTIEQIRVASERCR